MEYNYRQKTEELLRQKKLYKIQVVEAKIREYRKVFSDIKEHGIIKFSKNTTLHILKLSVDVFIGLLILTGVFCLFPLEISVFINPNTALSLENDPELISALSYMGYALFILSIPFMIISYLLKKNIQKRNTIYRLSKLVNEVIDYMEEDTKSEKQKYEYFIDTMAELKQEEELHKKYTLK